MRPFRNYSFTLSDDISDINQDENEKFALFKCTSYLMGLLLVRPIYDDETIKFLLWILRAETKKLMGSLNDHIIKKKDRKNDDEIKQMIIDPDECTEHICKSIWSMDKNRFKKIESVIHTLLERRKNELHCNGSSSIEKKLLAFKGMFKLTDQEIEFSTFLLIISLWDTTEEYFVSHIKCQAFTNRRYLASILQIQNRSMEKIFDGMLSRISFFDMNNHVLNMTDDFIEFFQKPSQRILSNNFYKELIYKPIPLSMHMIDKDTTDHLINLMKKKPKLATHVLIYGPPGTGKTNYASGLIKELGLVGYEIIKHEDNKSNIRRAAIVACCNMKRNEEGAVIVIDEADNILNTQNAWCNRGETQDKGWLNQLLEEKGIRMIWITNSIDAIEDSVIRRFSYSIHFKSFNRRQRVQLWESILKKNRIKKLYGQEEIQQLAKNYKVNAGVINLAVQKTLETYSIIEHVHYKKAITLSLDAHQALTHQGYKPIQKTHIEEQYSLDGLNIKGDLTVMIHQLEKFDSYLRQKDRNRNMNMNLLFYGPPGTGKSELARYISHRLDRELHCKRASDIFDPYVGMTERNIRRIFQEAEDDDAVLIIDEADSLLCSRDRAVRSWELSFTNEFLTQMERFNGILICTTNRIKDLDSASVRRFNHKIEFCYLTAEGNLVFYNLFLKPFSHEVIDEKFKQELATIDCLAPGDFKVVRDRYSFTNNENITHNELILALQEERRAKEIYLPSRKSIGF